MYNNFIEQLINLRNKDRVQLQRKAGLAFAVTKILNNIRENWDKLNLQAFSHQDTNLLVLVDTTNKNKAISNTIKCF
jgi:hypothetical protein